MLYTLQEIFLTKKFLFSQLYVIGGSDAKASAYKRPGVQSLGGEDMEIHSTILALRVPKIEKTGGLQFMGPQRVGHD